MNFKKPNKKEIDDSYVNKDNNYQSERTSKFDDEILNPNINEFSIYDNQNHIFISNQNKKEFSTSENIQKSSQVLLNRENKGNSNRINKSLLKFPTNQSNNMISYEELNENIIFETNKTNESREIHLSSINNYPNEAEKISNFKSKSSKNTFNKEKYSQIMVKFLFKNTIEDELQYDLYSIINTCPKLGKIIKSNPNITSIPIILPEEISNSDLIEYFFICKNGFEGESSPQTFKILTLSALLGNDDLASKEIVKEIENNRLSKFVSFKYLQIAYNRLNDELINDEIHSSWFELFFASLDVVSRNIVFFMSNGNYSYKLCHFNKELIEEIIDKYYTYISRQNILYEDEDDKSYQIPFSIISKQSITSLLILNYLKREDKLNDKVLLNFQSSENNFHINTNQIQTTEGSVNTNSSNINKLIDMIYTSYFSPEFILDLFIKENLYINSRSSYNEIISLSKPLFTIPIPRSFENIYKEFSLIINGNKLILTLIVYYKKHEDSLFISIKSSSSKLIDESPLLENIFKNLTIYFTFSIDENHQFDEGKVVNLMTNHKSNLFYIRNFKKKLKVDINKEFMDIKIKGKFKYIHSAYMSILSKMLNLLYNSLLIPKLQKEILVNLVKLSNLNTIANEKISNTRLLQLIYNWISEESNSNEDMSELYDMVEINNREELEIFMDVIFKNGFFIKENDTVKEKINQKISGLYLKLGGYNDVMSLIIQSSIKIYCKLSSSYKKSFTQEYENNKLVETIIFNKPKDVEQLNQQTNQIISPILKNNEDSNHIISLTSNDQLEMKRRKEMNELSNTNNTNKEEFLYKLNRENIENSYKTQKNESSEIKKLKCYYPKNFNEDIRKVNYKSNKFINLNRNQSINNRIGHINNKSTVNNKLFYESIPKESEAKQNILFKREIVDDIENNLNRKTRNLGISLLNKRNSKEGSLLNSNNKSKINISSSFKNCKIKINNISNIITSSSTTAGNFNKSKGGSNFKAKNEKNDDFLIYYMYNK